MVRVNKKPHLEITYLSCLDYKQFTRYYSLLYPAAFLYKQSVIQICINRLRWLLCLSIFLSHLSYWRPLHRDWIAFDPFPSCWYPILRWCGWDYLNHLNQMCRHYVGCLNDSGGGVMSVCSSWVWTGYNNSTMQWLNQDIFKTLIYWANWFEIFRIRVDIDWW